MGPNYYPPGGRDWVSTSDIRREVAHSQAQLLEKYHHDVAALREQFFGKLHPYRAIDSDGFGWAVFNDGELEGDTEEPARKVLLICASRPNTLPALRHPVPVMRIITNEPVIGENGHTYVTEDITIFENGHASYHLGAMLTHDETGEQVADLNEALSQSVTPIFVISDDNILFVSPNAGATTPHSMLTDESFPDDSVFPYGNPEGEFISDRIYAIERAQAIMQSILGLEPSQVHGRVV